MVDFRQRVTRCSRWMNDTGVVRDILIYQGGYVRIRGKYWLDRNLAAGGKLAQVAIPLGLEVDTTLNQGTYFQFGCPTDRWEENFTPCRGSWYDGTAESPARINELDPSPEGWRLPSRIEMEALMNSPAAPMELQREEDRTNICLLSDDGVPVYLPLCGHGVTSTAADCDSAWASLLDGEQPKPGIWLFALRGTQPADVSDARYEKIWVSGEKHFQR